LTLTALHPDRTAEAAIENTGWDLQVATELKTTEPPSEEELRILYDELDPDGLYLKRA